MDLIESDLSLGAYQMTTLLQSGLKPSAWDELRKEHDYTEAPPELNTSDIDVPDVGAGIDVFRALGIGILIVLLVLAILWLVSKIKKGNTKSKTFEGQKENLPEEVNVLTPLEQLWQAYEDARKSGNYREAVRILYQIVVKQLNDSGKLLADPDKTNREYLFELIDTPYFQNFSKLTRFHEFSWYGGQTLPLGDFSRIEPVFLSFIDHLKNEK
jgi:hypothetical protein